MCRVFKRSTNSVATIIGLIVILITDFFLILFDSSFGLFSVTSFLFLVVYIIVITVIIPPDFDYSIRSNDYLVTIEMSRKDHRVITRSFSIVSQTRSQIVLDDGISRIPIAYNRKVLEFLNEIKI